MTMYRLLGGKLVAVEIIRTIRPLDFGSNAGAARFMIRHVEAVDTHNIAIGLVRPVLARHVVNV